MSFKLKWIKKIWDKAKHNALTDLIFFKGSFFVVFRESDAHVNGKNGVIRILKSWDCKYWFSIARFEKEGFDLRDPKLSQTAKGELYLLTEAVQYDKKGKYIKRFPLCTFSKDGAHWSPLVSILDAHHWLWRVVWCQKKAYGISYTPKNHHHPAGNSILYLFSSNDGIHYTNIYRFDIEGYPNETTIRFFSNGIMYALVRKDTKGDNHALLGKSCYPFNKWIWKDLGRYLGGPNFLITADKQFLFAGRIVEQGKDKTALCILEKGSLQPVILFPSGGDNSYPGMVLQKNTLWISYYSSHEKNTAIYLAKIQILSPLK